MCYTTGNLVSAATYRRRIPAVLISHGSTEHVLCQIGTLWHLLLALVSGLGRVWRLFGGQDITLEALVSVHRLSEHLAIEPLQVTGVDHEG